MVGVTRILAILPVVRIALPDLMRQGKKKDTAMQYNDSWSVAVHEAGHVIVGLECGHQIGTVRIMACGPCGDKLNCTCGETSYRNALRRGTPEETAIGMAGHVAIEILYGKMLDIEETGSLSDFVNLVWSRILFNGVSAATSQERARKILLARWGDVLAVATELRKKTSLTGEEIEVILGKVKKAA